MLSDRAGSPNGGGGGMGPEPRFQSLESKAQAPDTRHQTPAPTYLPTVIPANAGIQGLSCQNV
ncbi:hypothetical protein [Lysobacter gummosus]|uniref:hypothetical protein n=1 Tax=Lysobacter gummosus TaxID=262324 RepID=UPI003636AE83